MSLVAVLVAPDGHVQVARNMNAARQISELHAAMTAAGITGWTATEMDATKALGRLAEDCEACRMPCGCSADAKLERRCPHRLKDSAPPVAERGEEQGNGGNGRSPLRPAEAASQHPISS